jgi:8-oxo-dGTP diphosphatase
MHTKFIVVVSLVIEHKGHVLLVRRSASSDHAPGEWESVSGRVESGETPAGAARREALEETGLDVDVLDVLDTFHYFRGAAREEAIGMTFHCRVAGGQFGLSAEHSAAAWVAPEAARGYALPEGLLRCIDGVAGRVDGGG